MQPAVSGTTGPQHAITDLYDEERNTFLIQYPPQLIIALGLTGVLAFALVGFLGYGTDDPAVKTLFGRPWPLFFWFCALIIVLQASIFRSPTLTKQRAQAVFATLVSMAIIIYYELFGNPFDQISIWIGQLIPFLGKGGILYVLLNFGILTVYWSDTIRRWVRYRQGKPIIPQIDIGLRRTTDKAEQRRPEFSELVSGDLLAGAVLTLVMSFFFNKDILTQISHAFNGPSTNGCGNVDCSGIDFTQFTIYLPIGLLVLALTAVINGLREARGVTPDPSMPDPVPNTGPRPGFEKGTKGVVETIIDTLIAAITRQGQGLFVNLALALRAALWPLLVFTGVAAAGVAARELRFALHYTNQYTTNCASQGCTDSATTQFSRLAQHHVVGIVGVGVLVLAIIFAAGLQVYQIRVAENSLRFAGFIGFVLLLTLWIFGLALWAVNLFVYRLGVQNLWPFPAQSPTNIISLAALLVYAVILFAHNGRRRNNANARLLIPTLGPSTFRRQQEARTPTVTPAKNTTPSVVTSTTADVGPPTQPMDN